MVSSNNSTTVTEWVLRTEKRKFSDYKKLVELISQMPALLVIDPLRVRTQLVTVLSMLQSHFLLSTIQEHKAPQLNNLLFLQKQAVQKCMVIIESQTSTTLQDLDLELLLDQITKASELSKKILANDLVFHSSHK